MIKPKPYAVIFSGGKQYRLWPGQFLKLEKLAGQPGSALIFDKVLMVADGDNIDRKSVV